MPETLVLDDRTLVNLGEPIVGGVGQGDAIGPDFNAAIGVFVHLDILANQAPAYRRIGKQIEHLVVLQREAVRNAPWLPLRKDQLKVLVLAHRPMRIEIIARWLAESRVV